MIRFRLFGIPFGITTYFWIGSAILGSSAARGDDGLWLLAVWVLCVLVSIVAHELGHALAGRAFGLQPYVVLYQFGGLTYLPGGQLPRGKNILVSLAGPAAGFGMFLAAFAAYVLTVRSGHADLLYAPTRSAILLREVKNDLFFINGFWTFFNLLPILPLDGGQVLRDVLGPRWIGVCRIIGAVCAAVCCAGTAWIGMYITAFFLAYLAYMNFVGDTRSLPGGVKGG